MRIVKFSEFLQLPAGTLFSKYEPEIFEHLSIKGDTLSSGDDFFYQPIVDAVDPSTDFHTAMIRMEGGASISMDFYCESRDGCYEEDQLFAVWERVDVEALFRRLNKALVDACEVEPDAGRGAHGDQLRVPKMREFGIVQRSHPTCRVVLPLRGMGNPASRRDDGNRMTCLRQHNPM